LTESEIDALIGTRDYKLFLNTRNDLYRERNMKEKPPSRAEAIRLMAAHPNLIRRPILVKGSKIVLGFDEEGGTIELQAGIEWPGLIEYLASKQGGREPQWGIAQKQTGADRLSIGGAISANVHGRGLKMRPLIADLESFQLVNADGEVLTCSRDENEELFRLAAGGYGLFGCIHSAILRLLPRRTLERVVEVRLLDA